MRLGMMGQGGLKQSSGGIAYTGLSAPTLTRTSAVTAYPPTADFTRPIDWADVPTMFGVMQISADPTFATGVSEVTNTITAAVLTYNFGLSAIVTPQIRYFRLGAYTGARPAVLLWSNIAGVGDAVAPTITSSAAPTGYQFIAGSLTLTADKAATWAIVGGADMAQFSLTGSTLTYTAQAVAGTKVVQVQATSYFNVASTVQTINLSVAVNTPTAFVFTDITGATLSTVYTSNTITVAGVVGGASMPVSITGGTYSKNGGAYVSTAGAAINGDTFAVRLTSNAANNAIDNVALTIGATSDTYSVSTPVVLSTTSAWNSADKSASIVISGAGSLTAANSNVGVFNAVRGTASKANNIRQIEATISSIGNGANTGIGFANSTASLSAYIGNDINGTCYFHTNFISYNGASGTTGATFTAGDKIGAVWNQSAATVTYYKNGVSQGVISTANLNATLFPAFCDSGGGSLVLNTGGTSFTYPISGAVAWDT